MRRSLGGQLASQARQRSVRGRKLSGGGPPSDSTYGRLMAKAPITMSGLSALTLWGAGDVLAQILEYYTTKSKTAAEVQWNRLCGCMTHGFFIGGVGGYIWYEGLERFVTNTMRAIPGSNRAVVLKLLLEILIWHPTCLLGYWSIVGKFEGHSTAQICAELKESFLPTLAGDVSMWTPVDILNFRFVPVHMQALVVNVGSLVEAVVLSYVHGLGNTDHKISEATAVAASKRPKFLDGLFSNADAVENVVADAKAQFSILDADHNGYLTITELESFKKSKALLPGTKNSAVSDKVLELTTRKARWNQICAAKSTTSAHSGISSPVIEGNISESEYLRLLQTLHEGGYRRSSTVDAIFTMFDVNKDEKIDRFELAGLVFVYTGAVPSTEEVDGIFAQLDINGDGTISPAEFKHALDSFEK